MRGELRGMIAVTDDLGEEIDSFYTTPIDLSEGQETEEQYLYRIGNVVLIIGSPSARYDKHYSVERIMDENAETTVDSSYSTLFSGIRSLSLMFVIACIDKMFGTAIVEIEEYCRKEGIDFHYKNPVINQVDNDRPNIVVEDIDAY